MKAIRLTIQFLSCKKLIFLENRLVDTRTYVRYSGFRNRKEGESMKDKTRQMMIKQIIHELSADKELLELVYQFVIGYIAE